MELCCDGDQILAMEAGMNQADGVYSRCPTCVFNMGLSICSMTCAHNHSLFLTPHNSINDNGVEYVQSIDYRIDDDFVRTIYDNCKGIQHPQTGRPAMDLGCGAYNAKSCDHRKWYNFMGDVEVSDYVPFPINYIFLNESSDEGRLLMYPLNCSQAYENSYACACIDCAESCPITDVPVAYEDVFLLMGLYIIAGFVVFIVAMWIFELLRAKTRCFGCFAGFGCFNDVLYVLFRGWGTFCAKHPVLVLAILSWVIGGLCYGVRYMQVTTDPVELWAGEESQTRLEKEYFDSHFGPFYRTNQLFIKPRNMSNVRLNCFSVIDIVHLKVLFCHPKDYACHRYG